jgi:hypothetical protein
MGITGILAGRISVRSGLSRVGYCVLFLWGSTYNISVPGAFARFGPEKTPLCRGRTRSAVRERRRPKRIAGPWYPGGIQRPAGAPGYLSAMRLPMRGRFGRIHGEGAAKNLARRRPPPWFRPWGSGGAHGCRCGGRRTSRSRPVRQLTMRSKRTPRTGIRIRPGAVRRGRAIHLREEHPFAIFFKRSRKRFEFRLAGKNWRVHGHRIPAWRPRSRLWMTFPGGTR